ncbi:MAG: serine hydrolase [Bacteroidota bacterium]
MIRSLSLCILAGLSIVMLMSCEPQPPENLILSLLEGRGEVVDQVLADPERYELQILYTQIDRDSVQRPIFTSHSYRLNAEQYFYPASTVKFPVAVMALEKLQLMGINGLNPQTTMLTDSAFSGQTSVRRDSTSPDGMPSIEHYVRKIFVVSDNDAFNRLYEFVGQGPINQRLQQLGLKDSRISHRLSIAMSGEENRHTNPIRFVEGEELIYEQAAAENQGALSFPEPILRGKGVQRGGEIISEPMDFSRKNAFPLADQQDFLTSIIFPNDVNGVRPDLSEKDFQLLYQYMSQLPRETTHPAYDPAAYFDSYVKFFLYGDNKAPMPSTIRIFNKVGQAYGYLTDNAYVVDVENEVEFLLSATIFVNENQIFNDETYEYDEIGFPFLAELGRAVYEYELQRPRTKTPDLSRFHLRYDQ